MKRLLKRAISVLPESCRARLVRVYRHERDRLRLVRGSVYDYRNFGRYSGLHTNGRRSVSEASLIRTYHRIEKGLALPEPRPGFGGSLAEQLLRDVRDHQRAFSPDRTSRAALNAMSEYLRFNEERGILNPELRHAWEDLLTAQAECGGHDEGGTIEIERDALLAASRIDLRAFFDARHSVRQFSAVAIPAGLVEAAVCMAQRSPSVCNRQAARVYFTRDRLKMARLLYHQNGNRGFGDRIDTLFVITASLDCFLTVGERYQCWIDGGMFAMSFIFALHSLGVGTCCLNWSVEPETDRNFKLDAGIPNDQAVIMLLAAGMLPARFRVATSTRRPIDEVLRPL